MIIVIIYSFLIIVIIPSTFYQSITTSNTQTNLPSTNIPNQSSTNSILTTILNQISNPPNPASNSTPNPTTNPAQNSTNSSTIVLSNVPTNSPTNLPTMSPTNVPTNSPTHSPTSSPTNQPTISPTSNSFAVGPCIEDKERIWNAFKDTTAIDVWDKKESNWEGITCETFSNGQQGVTVIDLSNKGLTGTFYLEQLQDMKFINEIGITANELQGDLNFTKIPTSLEKFYASENRFGTVDFNFPANSQLKELEVYSTFTRGQTINSWRLPQSLESISIEENEFKGGSKLLDDLPERIGYIYMRDNQFSGEINWETFCKNHPNIVHFDIAGNDYNGTVMLEYFVDGVIQYIQIGGNSFQGELNVDKIANSLTDLYASDNQFSSIGFNFPINSQLVELSLDATVTTDQTIGSWRLPDSLLSFSIADNQFKGDSDLLDDIPIGIEYLIMRGNQFSGEINWQNFGQNHQNLEELRINDNHYEGSVILNYFADSVVELELTSNEFTKLILNATHGFPNGLRVFVAEDNEFQGEINWDNVDKKNVEEVHLEDNQNLKHNNKPSYVHD